MVTFTLAGDASSFNTTRFRINLSALLSCSSSAVVHPSDVELEVRTASVVLRTTVHALAASAAHEIAQYLQGASHANLSVALGEDVLGVSDVTVQAFDATTQPTAVPPTLPPLLPPLRPPPPPSPPPPSTPLPLSPSPPQLPLPTPPSPSPPPAFAQSTAVTAALTSLDVQASLTAIEVALNGSRVYESDQAPLCATHPHGGHVPKSDNATSCSSTYLATKGNIVHAFSLNSSAPLTVGNVSVWLDGAGNARGGMSVVVLTASPLGEDISSPGTTVGDGHDAALAPASLASPLISVRLVKVDNAPGGSDLALGDTVSVEMPVDDEPAFMTPGAPNSSTASSPASSSCEPFELFRGMPLHEKVCVAGCCIDGACTCRAGYVGRFCDQELRCSIVLSGQSSFDSGDVCVTHAHADARRVVCTCSRVGTLAVVRFRLTPATNSLSAANLIGFVRTADWSLRSNAYALSFAAVSLILCLLLLLALLADSSIRFISHESSRLPGWLRPHAFSYRQELLMNILTRSSLLRLFWVYPSFTVYTHAQLVLVLVNNLALNAACVALFLGTTDCNSAAVFVGAVSMAVASLFASCGRLLFRWANFSSHPRMKSLYYMNKRSRISGELQGPDVDERRTQRASQKRERGARRLPRIKVGPKVPKRLQKVGAKVPTDAHRQARGSGGCILGVHSSSATDPGEVTLVGLPSREDRAVEPNSSGQGCSHPISDGRAGRGPSGHQGLKLAFTYSGELGGSPTQTASPSQWSSQLLSAEAGLMGACASPRLIGNIEISHQPRRRGWLRTPWSESQTTASSPPPSPPPSSPPFLPLSVQPPRVPLTGEGSGVDLLHMPQEAVIWLHRTKIAPGPDRCGSPGFWIQRHEFIGAGCSRGKHDAAGDALVFVHATHISEPWYAFGRLRVTFRATRDDACQIAAKQIATEAESSAEAVLPPLCSMTFREAIAWSINWLLLWCSALGLLSAFMSHAFLADELQASTMDVSDWHAAFLGCLGFSLLDSFLIIDAIKIGLLTVTADSTGTSQKRFRLLRKLMRRLHKVIDVVN